LRRLLLLVVISAAFYSCNLGEEKPEIATVLSTHFKNKLYNKFDTAVYKPIFISKLNQKRGEFLNPNLVTAFYQSKEHLPQFVTKFYTSGGLDTLKSYISRSDADGFNPEVFELSTLQRQLQLLGSNKFKTIDEVYEAVAELELSSANVLNKYTNFMSYGSVNPRNVFNRYYIKLKRPDSAKMDTVLNTTDIQKLLENVQPKDKQYQNLKKALSRYRDSLKDEDNYAIKSIKMNLERMRWRMPLQTEEKVVVNIPDFRLTWYKGDDTVVTMKVCVGSKREEGYAEKIKVYLKSGKLDDKPKNHETPQLFSVFNAIQVNPIWNIPVSIAKSEIYWMARKDRYYLSNNNIKVYHQGKLVEDPDTIEWEKYPREKLPFHFKQGSGEGNALGKFKFVFDNSSSIYLHDTNNKSAFNRANRAISHGCVRVEDPLKFAELMVKNEREYDRLRMEVDLPPIDTTKNAIFKKKLARKVDTLNIFKLKPSWFPPRKNIAVIISYYTAWADNNGKVHFRPDVYDYDPILWASLKRYM
jgi:murein L,D-transpeptidase YcbB/YkuD